MENLSQIGDLFQGKNRIGTYDVKEDKWLKSRSQQENTFKEFSEALNKQINTEDPQQDEKQDSAFVQEMVNENFNQSTEITKHELQKQNDDLFKEPENFNGPLSVVPWQPEVSNTIGLNDVEYHSKEIFYDKGRLVLEDDKIHLDDTESFVSKNFNEITDNLSEKNSQKENEELVFCDEKIPVIYDENEKFTETEAIPFIIENQNNFQGIKAEETWGHKGRIEFESVEEEAIPQEIKRKIGTEKGLAKVSVQKEKEFVASNIITSQHQTVNLLDKFVQIKNLDITRNFGTDHALKSGKIKVGIVSTKQISSFDVERHQKLKIAEQDVQQASDASSNKNAENRILFLRQDNLIFKQEESTTLPKVVMQKYDEVRQNYTDSVNGVIAAISEQVEELKRVRRNSLNVKIDLANGESLNCQLVLSKENLNVRFPTMAEDFKAQIIEHWNQLKHFAKERNFNLLTPFFANPLS